MRCRMAIELHRSVSVGLSERPLRTPAPAAAAPPDPLAPRAQEDAAGGKDRPELQRGVAGKEGLGLMWGGCIRFFMASQARWRHVASSG